jgi:FAD-dependent urate hydroxylase
MVDPTPRKAIIIGAGMGGLAAGIALRQMGYGVEIYDRTASLRAAGAAISLWSNGIKVLNQWGLGSAIARVGGDMAHMAYYRSTGECLTQFSLAPLVERVGQRPYPVSRTALQTILLEAAGGVTLGAECVGIEQSDDRATAVFANGHRATGDLVIAADGARSTLRNGVAGRAIDRQYVGYVNWNGLVSVDEALAPANTWVMYVGKGQRVSLMPAGADQFYFFLDVPLAQNTPNNRQRYREELHYHFKDWAAPVQALIQRLNPETTNRIEIHDMQPLKRFVQGRVVLLGDAAHSMAPDLGQGGCLALEDAWVLADVLLQNVDLPAALQAYDHLRVDRAAELIRRARKRSDITHGKDTAMTAQWYEELAQEDGSGIIDGICKTILGGPLG